MDSEHGHVALALLTDDRARRRTQEAYSAPTSSRGRANLRPVNPRPQGRAIVGVLIAAAIFTLVIVSQRTGDGGGRSHHAAFGGGGGFGVGATHRHQERERRRHHRRRHGERDRNARHANRAHHRTDRRHGLIASHCSYRDPASSACGDIPPPDTCELRAGGALQDPGCTPGAIDPRVTQSSLDRTICVSGYTTEVRPPYSYTAPIEAELIDSYGLGVSSSATELDHVISLELGGAPADPRNLFPEAYAGRRGATDKDALENRLHAEVCAGSISLAKAQHEILDWIRYQAPLAKPTSPPSSSAGTSAGGGGGSASRGGGAGSGCDPDYSGACLDPNASDYDCAGGGGDGPKYVQGPIRVTGSDPYYLDGDGDGIGCD